MSGIRVAQPSDLQELLALLEAFHGESIFSQDTVLNRAKLTAFVQKTLIEPNRICIVHEAVGRIDGLALAYIAEYFFSRDRAAWDFAVYVVPERRGSRVAFRLWKGLKSWAEREGAKTLWLGTSAGIQPERSRKFYRGLGMDEVGSIYRLRLG